MKEQHKLSGEELQLSVICVFSNEAEEQGISETEAGRKVEQTSRGGKLEGEERRKEDM